MDSYGALPIPVPAPAAGDSVADPALNVLGRYLRAVLNRYAVPAWASVAPGQDVVKTATATGAEDQTFNERDLPALFLWRTNENFARIADDWETDTSTVSVLWVPRPGPQAQLALRATFYNAVCKLINTALWNSRDPAWVDPTDPDPLASVLGSSVCARAGLLYQLTKQQSRPYTLTIQIDDAEPRAYPGILTTFEIAERFEPDLAGLTAYPALRSPAALDLELTIGGATAGTVVESGGFSNGFDFGFQTYALDRSFDSGMDSGFG